MATLKYWPLWELTITRLRVFYREPAAVFWVYGFPLVMALSLGTAFRENPTEVVNVDIVAGTQETASESLAVLEGTLRGDSRFQVHVQPEEDWKKRLQAGKTDLVVELDSNAGAGYRFWVEPHRTESRLARYAVESLLLRPHAASESRAPGAPDAPEVKHLEQAGSRYIDFLIPGLIGLNLMGGGLWGVGFVIVDLRVRKLLKRFLATPMRKSDFLLAIMTSRLFFTLIDIAILLVFGYFAFGVKCIGNYADLAAVVVLGGVAFAGIGLLVAARVQTIESVSGLMNLVMLPMWILSGVFFSSERFPTEIQPLINLLPLTALIQALRGVMLEAKSLASLWPQAAILASYTAITFLIALKVFRWR